MTNENTTPTTTEAAPAKPAKASKPAAERKVGTAAKKAAKKPSKPVVTKAKPDAKPAKKAAKPKAAKLDQPSKSVIPLEVAKSYQRVKSEKDGKVHIDNGDEVANKLRGLDLDKVYALTAKACDIAEKDLRAKYKHLNVGMQRMNLGNKLRAAL